MSPRVLPLVLLATLVAVAILIAGGPETGVALPGLAPRKAWALETVAAIGTLVWTIARMLAPAAPSAANDNDRPCPGEPRRVLSAI